MRRNRNRSVALGIMALAASSCEGSERMDRDDALRSQTETTTAVEPEALEPEGLIVHPLLSEQALAAPRSADMLSRVDDDGFGWTLEEGWGAADEGEGEGEVQKFSGLYRARAVWSSPERRSELNAGKPPRLKKGERPHREPVDKIDPRLLVDDGPGTAGGEAGQVVMIALRKPPRDTIDNQLVSLMLSGDIESSSELEEWRATLMQERADLIAAVQAPVRSAIETAGGKVTWQGKVVFGIDAVIPASALLAVAALTEVEQIDASSELVENASGVGVGKGSQLTQFINSGHDGENGSLNESHVAVVESKRLLEEHLGFNEGSGASDRIASMTQCQTSGSCFSVNAWSFPTGSHATEVAGLLLGDLRDGQDPTVTNSTERTRRSGYANEARLHMYRAANGTTSLRKSLDHIADRDGANKPRIANLSTGGDEDFNCDGETALSRAANDVFESGTLIVSAAGNQGHSNSSDCRVVSPGSAIGVFTVGSHGNSINENVGDVRYGAINTNSSQGGSTAQGEGRTIIDVSGYGCRKLVFSLDGGYAESGCGTSYAAPTVAAAAVDYESWFRHFNSGSTTMRNPAYMYTALLIQGDRQGTPAKLNTGFSSLWGAGRLKMRKGSLSGMDAPSLWKVGRTCVADGQEKVISVNSGTTLSSDVDDLKAVIYWYDPQHEVGIPIDDIDLYLENTNNNVVRTSNGLYDNKERVYKTNAGGAAYQLRIVGNNVTYDGSSLCGSNSMLVYYSYFYEDDDRDDSNGPSLAEIDPE